MIIIGFFQEVSNLKVESKKLISWMRKVTNDLNKVVFFDNYEPSAIEEKLEEFEVRNNNIALEVSSRSELNNVNFVLFCPLGC